MRLRAEWYWQEPSPPKPNVYEREPDVRPILYRPDGTPLVTPPPSVGFRLPDGGEKR